VSVAAAKAPILTPKGPLAKADLWSNLFPFSKAGSGRREPLDGEKRSGMIVEAGQAGREVSGR